MGVQVLVTDPKELEAIRQREQDITKERIQKLLDAGGWVAGWLVAGCKVQLGGCPAPTDCPRAIHTGAYAVPTARNPPSHRARWPRHLPQPACAPTTTRPHPSGANVVLTARGVDDLALKYFVEAGAIALRRVPKDDLK